MKYLLLALLGLVLSAPGFAQSVKCESANKILTIAPEGDPVCHAMKLEGVYKVTLCSTGTGTMIGEDKSIRFLFRDGEGWKSRADNLDFLSRISDSEIFNFNWTVSNFSMERIKTKQNGAVISRVLCVGGFEAVKDDNP